MIVFGSVAEPEPVGKSDAEDPVKLLPELGPDPKLLNYGSESGSGSGSFLFIKGLMQLKKKSSIFYHFNYLTTYLFSLGTKMSR